MGTSVYDLNQERKVDHGGPQYLGDIHHINPAVWKKFPVGTKVIVRCAAQDFNFFYDEAGTVIRNNMHYLGIIVQFDEPRHFKGGYVQTHFNFEPDDLEIISTPVRTPILTRRW